MFRQRKRFVRYFACSEFMFNDCYKGEMSNAFFVGFHIRQESLFKRKRQLKKFLKNPSNENNYCGFRFVAECSMTYFDKQNAYVNINGEFCEKSLLVGINKCECGEVRKPYALAKDNSTVWIKLELEKLSL